MRADSLVVLFSALAVAAPAFACTPEIGLAVGSEKLGAPRQDWRSYELDALCRAEDRRTISGAVTRESRFGLYDTSVRGAWYQPAGTRTGWLFEAQYSPDARFLPRHGFGVTVDHALADGWVVHAGVRRASYRESEVDTVQLTGERYLREFRFAWVYSHGFLRGGGSAGAHRVHAERWLSDTDRIGVLAVHGREAERLAPKLLQVTRVRGLGAYGQHWVSDNWGLTWNIGWHEQGDFYTRRGVRLGVRHRF